MAKTNNFRTRFKDQAEHFMANFATLARHEGDGEFAQYCLDTRDEILERQKKLDLMFAHFDQFGIGCIFASAQNDRWSLILPDASVPGKFRYQQFASYGWVSHYTCETLDEVIFESYEAGMYVPAPADTLNRLSATREWAEGIERLDIITRHNRREIDWKSACELMDQVREKYASMEAA